MTPSRQIFSTSSISPASHASVSFGSIGSGKWGTRTASGKKAKQGRTIAVDRRKIKLGTKVKIKGKTYVAEDVGGGVKGKHIDVFFSSHKQTMKFGKKTGVKVYIFLNTVLCYFLLLLKLIL